MLKNAFLDEECSGGIGRHYGLKIHCTEVRESSNLSSGTANFVVDVKMLYNIFTTIYALKIQLLPA